LGQTQKCGLVIKGLIHKKCSRNEAEIKENTVLQEKRDNSRIHSLLPAGLYLLTFNLYICNKIDTMLFRSLAY
jgi:hypothetical protein